MPPLTTYARTHAYTNTHTQDRAPPSSSSDLGSWTPLSLELPSDTAPAPTASRLLLWAAEVTPHTESPAGPSPSWFSEDPLLPATPPSLKRFLPLDPPAHCSSALFIFLMNLLTGDCLPVQWGAPWGQHQTPGTCSRTFPASAAECLPAAVHTLRIRAGVGEGRL